MCPFTDMMRTHAVCPYILLKFLTNLTACKRMIWNISLLKTKSKMLFFVKLHFFILLNKLIITIFICLVAYYTNQLWFYGFKI